MRDLYIDRTCPDEYAAVCELDALLVSTDWWVSTSPRPIELTRREQIHSPTHKPRECVWFSKGGWLGHACGGIHSHLMIAKVQPEHLCEIRTLADLDKFSETYKSQTSAIDVRPRSSSSLSSSSRSSSSSSDSPRTLRQVPLYHWDKVSLSYKGWAMPVNLYDPATGDGWGVCTYDVSSLALWDPSAIVESFQCDLDESGPDEPEGYWSVRHTILPLVRRVLQMERSRTQARLP